MDTVLLSSILTGVAVFSVLMFIFEPWLFPPQPKLDAVRASVLSRERYEPLLLADPAWWGGPLGPGLLAPRVGDAGPRLAGQRARHRPGRLRSGHPHSGRGLCRQARPRPCD